jgi:hypothetical protein
MEPQVTNDQNDQMLVGGVFFIFVAFLASAAVIDYSREKKPLLLNFPGPRGSDIDAEIEIDIDAEPLEEDHLLHGSFDDPEDLYAYKRSRLLAFQSRDSALPSSQWA